jgi:hypothetical protein
MKCRRHSCNRRGHRSLNGLCGACYRDRYVVYEKPVPRPKVNQFIDVAYILSKDNDYIENGIKEDRELLIRYLRKHGPLTRKQQNLFVFKGNRTAKQLAIIRNSLIRDKLAVEVVERGTTKPFHVLYLVERDNQ